MDYDWKYYLEDLKAGKKKVLPDNRERAAAGLLLYRLTGDKRRQIRGLVKNMLEDYRRQDGMQNEMIEELMKAHARYCQMPSAGEGAKRRHNTVVYRYMMKTALHNRAVAVKTGVSRETVYSDINRATDEMAVICFGSPAASDDPATWLAGVRSLLRNYRLIKHTERVQGEVRWRNWQQDREEGRRITSDLLCCFEKVLWMYEDFTAGSSCPEIQGRRLEVVKGVYFNGISIPAIAAEHCISEETAYTDINTMIERLSELFQGMASQK